MPRPLSKKIAILSIILVASLIAMVFANSFELRIVILAGALPLAFLIAAILVKSINSNYKPLIQSLHDELDSSYEQLHTVVMERERQEILMRTIDSAASSLLSTAIEDASEFDSALAEGMEIVAQCVDIDAIYVFRNETIQGDSQYHLQAQWTNEIGVSAYPAPIRDNYSYSETKGWELLFQEGGHINGSISKLTVEEQAVFGEGTQSVLLLPMHLHDHFWGFLCYEDCKKEREFNPDEINLLSSASLMIVNAIRRKKQAVRINEANARVRIMIDATPVGCYLWNRDLQMFDCNRAMLSLFEVKDRDELAGRLHEDFTPEYQPDGSFSREFAIEHLRKAFADGYHEFEWTHRTLDGENFPTEVTLVRVWYDGEYVIAGYMRDVREEQRMIQEIKHRGSLLDTVNTAANILLQSEIDEFEDNIVRCLGMMAEAVDVDRACLWKNRVTGERTSCTRFYEWHNVITLEPSTDIYEYNKHLPEFENRLSKGLFINSKISDLEPETQMRLSEKGVLSVLAIPIFLRGDFWGFVTFDDCHNEREFSKNEESILRSGSLMIANTLLRNEMTRNTAATAAQLEAVIANYAGLIWSIDRTETITLFNGLALEYLNLMPMAVEGKFIDEMRWENPFFDILSHARETFTRGSQRWVNEIGDTVYNTRTTPVFDEFGNITDVVGSTDDITETVLMQSRLEQALQAAQDASKAKSNFLSNMSHEMRTPMNAIIGMTTIGKSASSIESKDDAFAKIEAASNHLLAVINDVLDMSKIEAGKLSLLEEPVHLEKTIQKTLDVILFRVEEKRQILNTHIDEGVPPMIIGDEQRLTQVLTNLLANAVKFTDEGKEIRLEVHLMESEDDCCTLKFSIIDQGIGISSQQQERLFTSFEQAELSTSRKFGGTGLGLAISKYIVDLMGGTIWIESELGKGATFAFSIKVKVVQDYVEADFESGDADEEFPNYAGKHLLLAEDVEINREIVIAVLEATELEIDCAEDGAEAVRMFQENPSKYDLIFMDIQMPNVDGFEASQKIRTMDVLESKTVPIVAMTANVFREDIEKCLEAGMNGHLGKPLDFEAVKQTLKKYLT